jgi:hypothetical protein
LPLNTDAEKLAYDLGEGAASGTFIKGLTLKQTDRGYSAEEVLELVYELIEDRRMTVSQANQFFSSLESAAKREIEKITKGKSGSSKKSAKTRSD